MALCKDPTRSVALVVRAGEQQLLLACHDSKPYAHVINSSTSTLFWCQNEASEPVLPPSLASTLDSMCATPTHCPSQDHIGFGRTALKALREQLGSGGETTQDAALQKLKGELAVKRKREPEAVDPAKRMLIQARRSKHQGSKSHASTANHYETLRLRKELEDLKEQNKELKKKACTM